LQEVLGLSVYRSLEIHNVGFLEVVFELLSGFLQFSLDFFIYVVYHLVALAEGILGPLALQRWVFLWCLLELFSQSTQLQHAFLELQGDVGRGLLHKPDTMGLIMSIFAICAKLQHALITEKGLFVFVNGAEGLVDGSNLLLVFVGTVTKFSVIGMFFLWGLRSRDGVNGPKYSFEKPVNHTILLINCKLQL